MNPTTDPVIAAIRRLSRSEAEGIIRFNIAFTDPLCRWLWRAAVHQIKNRDIEPFDASQLPTEALKANAKLLAECCPAARTYNYPAMLEVFREVIDLLVTELQNRDECGSRKTKCQPSAA